MKNVLLFTVLVFAPFSNIFAEEQYSDPQVTSPEDNFDYLNYQLQNLASKINATLVPGSISMNLNRLHDYQALLVKYEAKIFNYVLRSDVFEPHMGQDFYVSFKIKRNDTNEIIDKKVIFKTRRYSIANTIANSQIDVSVTYKNQTIELKNNVLYMLVNDNSTEKLSSFKSQMNHAVVLE